MTVGQLKRWCHVFLDAINLHRPANYAHHRFSIRPWDRHGTERYGTYRCKAKVPWNRNVAHLQAPTCGFWTKQPSTKNKGNYHDQIFMTHKDRLEFGHHGTLLPSSAQPRVAQQLQLLTFQVRVRSQRPPWTLQGEFWAGLGVSGVKLLTKIYKFKQNYCWWKKSCTTWDV